MIFLGLVNIERSAMRVLDRAINGGHNVPLPEIELNYIGNLAQLDIHYKLLDELKVIDTSEIEPKLLLHLLSKNVEFKVEFSDLPDWFHSHLIKITRLMYPHI